MGKSWVNYWVDWIMHSVAVVVVVGILVGMVYRNMISGGFYVLMFGGLLMSLGVTGAMFYTFARMAYRVEQPQ